MRWLFDSGIWLNHARNDAVRRAVDNVRQKDGDILTSPVSIAEMISVLHRRGMQEHAPALVRIVRELSTIATLDAAFWEETGKIHATERTRVADLSLADASILALARSKSAMLLTTDLALVKNRSGVRTKHVPIA